MPENPLFELGHCVMTPGIQDLIERYQFDAQQFLVRHQTGDWSEMDTEDQAANFEAINTGERIFSKYTFRPNAEQNIDLYVITEWDWSSTCLLLAEEY